MQKLDTLVTEHLMERLFKPERVAAILASLASRRAETAAALDSRLMTLQREMIDADDKLKRLYRLVEDGLTDLDEVLKDRLNALKADRDRGEGGPGTGQRAFGLSHPYRSGVNRALRPYHARELQPYHRNFDSARLRATLQRCRKSETIVEAGSAPVKAYTSGKGIRHTSTERFRSRSLSARSVSRSALHAIRYMSSLATRRPTISSPDTRRKAASRS